MAGQEEELTVEETPFNHLFGFKAVDDGQEVTYKGVPGVFVEGYMAVWKPVDRVGDTWNLDLTKGSVTRKALEDYFDKNPVVLFEHGRDQQVGKKVLGKTIEYEIDETGVWVKDFIPRPEKSAGAIYDIYQKIKAGIYQTFSICGRWAKDRKSAIVEVYDVFEHSIASVPVQGLATFTLSKTLEFQNEYGIDVEEALAIATDSKAGAVFSRANKGKIQQAIAVLEDLIGEADEDDGSSGAGGEPGPGMARGSTSASASTGKAKGKPNPFTGVRGTGAKSEERQETQALNNNYSKGATKTMSAKTQEKANVEGGDQQEETVTFTGNDAKAIKEMLAERDQLKIESEAKAIAEAQVAKERKDAEEAEEATRQRQSEIDAKALEIAKKIRNGSRMNFSGDAATGAKSFNINRGSANNEFSFIKFAKYGKEGREWQYVENQKSLDADYKALNETVGEQGGYLVPTEQSSEIVDLLRTQAVVRQMPGVKVIQMNSDTLSMARLTGGATAYWVAEGATMTTSQPTFGQIRFVARKLAAVVPITKELMRDSNPAVERVIREDIAASLALKEDDAFLQGSGIGEIPLGIMNTIGINSIAFSAGAASAAPEFKALVKAAALIRANSGKPNGIVHNPRIGDQILGVVDTTGQPIANNAIGGFRWYDMMAAGGRNSNDPNQVQFGSLLGMTQAFTTQLAMSADTSGTGTVLIGDWSKVYIGDRQGLEVEMDRSIGFLNDVVYLKVTKRTDIVLTLPQTFTKLTVFPGTDIA